MKDHLTHPDAREPTDKVVVRLPFPPANNNLFAGTTRRFPSGRYKKWQKEANAAIERHQELFGRFGAVRGPVAVSIRVSRPDKRRRDLANLEKAVTDRCVDHGLLEDDSMVQFLEMRWVPSYGTGGWCEITIEKASLIVH
jgi:crossover junction endodeoxyribonuclease RusA